jgi:predicted DNA-binding transcriptional regulator AlpA
MKRRASHEPLMLDDVTLDAIAERVITRLTAAMPSTKAPEGGGEFVPLKQAMKALGFRTRSAIYRGEQAGRLPRRLKMPSGRTGYLRTDIDAFLASLRSASPTKSP